MMGLRRSEIFAGDSDYQNHREPWKVDVKSMPLAAAAVALRWRSWQSAADPMIKYYLRRFVSDAGSLGRRVPSREDQEPL